MTGTWKFAVPVLLIVSLLAVGCADKQKTEDMDKEKVNDVYKQKLDDIEKTQKDIFAKVSAIEANQKEMMKFFKPRRPAVDYNKVYNIPLGSSKIRGNEKAPVTIVEFSDFQCPYCARLQPTIKEVLKAYPDEVRLVYKNFPLSFHKQAKNAAKAAHAAGEQGKYWEMHDLIFEKYNKLTEDMFKEFAGKLDLDAAEFQADYNSSKYDKQIEQDINLGKSLGVSGTPTLFINGKRMRNRSFDDFKNTIEGYLKKKK